MRVPAVIFADEALIDAMDDKVAEQISNVASLPGIVLAAYALPDAHWGYGFPIGGVAAFDPEEGGIVCAGGVGFDISCGVRTLLTGLTRADIEPRETGAGRQPVRPGPGRSRQHGQDRLGPARNGRDAGKAARAGRWRTATAAPRTCSAPRKTASMAGAAGGCRLRQGEDPPAPGDGHARFRQPLSRGAGSRGDLPTRRSAAVFGLRRGEIVVSIHCGSRGLGHQIATDYQREMAIAMPQLGITVPDLDLACAPIRSELGARYLGAMRAGDQLRAGQPADHHPPDAPRVRPFLSAGAKLDLLFDVSHNTCKQETAPGRRRARGTCSCIARGRRAPSVRAMPSCRLLCGKSASRCSSAAAWARRSAIMAGTGDAEAHAFASACHGAGRQHESPPGAEALARAAGHR